MEDLDALLAELEQSSRPASKDSVLQMPSSCKKDPATVGPPVPCGREPLASVALKVQLPPQAQPPGEALKTVYSSPIPVPQPLIPSLPPTAAARQLDELLADLGHMQSKVSLGPGGKEVGGLALTQPSSGPRHPPSWQLVAVGQGLGVPGEPKPSLDNMLGSLTRDLQELGITAAPASICATCHKPIAGKVLTALGKTWHPEHFTCAHCGQELGSQPFFERGGEAYCEEDYHQAFSPRCAYCAGPIREVRPPASHATPHRHQLSHLAASCRKSSRPWTRPGTPSTSSVPTVGRCSEMTECLGSFTSGSFFELQGRPYCELHFHQRQGNICHGCSRPVTGRCITAAGRKYHPEHFICAYCLGQLQKGTFREHGDKMYCRACHDKLFL
ncbi:leupaxin isoform X2 [Accipiter gentilis]|uniref:leupaxin isoform X2 n=1 Tax=Astur gentilis TaxID=8957 RepID=UPI00210F4384|nr:leupaxin isoform X2 [Accipiter gentilis]